MDPLDPQHFGFLDPDPDLQKHADPQIRIQGAKYQPKTVKKKLFALKTPICTVKKKRLLKASSSLNDAQSLSIKICNNKK